MPTPGAVSVGLFLFGPVFEHFPTLKMVVAEGDAGWVPHYRYRANHAAARIGTGLERTLSRKPSENIGFTFQDDEGAFEATKLIDGNQLLWATD